MDNLFPLNRYDVQPIIEHINSLSEIPETFEIEVEEPYLCIEINEGNLVDRDWLLEVISSFTDFDNMVQELCRKDAAKSPDKKPYFFEPAHMTISQYEVRIGYWATNVNSEFLAIFRKDDGDWRMVL